MKGKKKNVKQQRMKKQQDMKKQIAAVFLAGLLLIFADLFLSAGKTPQIISSYGQLYIMRPETGASAGELSLRAQITGKTQRYEKNIDVILRPYEKSAAEEAQEASGADGMEMTEQERFDYELRTIADAFNDDLSMKKIRLPETLDTGEKISWEIETKKQSNTLIIATMAMLVIAALYRSRNTAARKEAKENRESVIRELPEFVNRMVLLLNAGMVLNSAFEKTVEESMLFRENQNAYFYRKLKEVYGTVKTANGSMHKEFRRFARESGVKELMRVSNIISDNVSKGVELTHKLQNESELLWMNRKKRCEEMGRLAETKLTLPLVIFLMVLIVITVAPALLEL